MPSCIDWPQCIGSTLSLSNNIVHIGQVVFRLFGCILLAFLPSISYAIRLPARVLLHLVGARLWPAMRLCANWPWMPSSFVDNRYITSLGLFTFFLESIDLSCVMRARALARSLATKYSQTSMLLFIFTLKCAASLLPVPVASLGRAAEAKQFVPR